MLNALPSQFQQLLTTNYNNCHVNHWLPSLPHFTCLPDYIIAVPVFNEQARLPKCLNAIERAMQATPKHGRLLLLINNSSDESLEIAIEFAKRSLYAIEIFDVLIDKSAGCAGPARALALDLANLLVGTHGAIITTDADSLVHPDFVKKHLEALSKPIGLVCGNIEMDPSEQSKLPKEFLLRNKAEANYWRLSNQLMQLIDPDPLNPWPHHCNISGANMGIKASVYRRIGGMPKTDAGEDRALEQRVRQYDYAIYYSDAAKVTTSYRLAGRAKYGMASTLNERLQLKDFMCDSRLEPANMVWRRASWRAALREKWQSSANLTNMLHKLQLNSDIIKQITQCYSFGDFWHMVESASPVLHKHRIKSSQLTHEAKKLQTIIARAEELTAEPLYILQSAEKLLATAGA